MHCVVIYDSDHPGARQNICFTKEYAMAGPGHSFTVDLAEELRAKNIRCVTSDVYLAEERAQPGATALLITDMVSRNTNALIEKGAIPFLCMSTESPLIARSFYISIRSLAGRFLYNMQFRGTKERLEGSGTHFAPMFYPVESRTQIEQTQWNDRRFMVLINRNKRAFFHDHSSLKNTMRSYLSRLKVQIQRIRDPWIRSKEIYKDRIEAIKYFSAIPGFELYGMGWENPVPGFDSSYSDAARKVYKGALGPQDKLRTMSKFRFAICFENCAFPGYVTEKIFDCFLAGCIPVYFGAPDITDFVPAETFVDFRRFASMEALGKYLEQMPEADGISMIEAAREFLSSKKFDRHFQPNITKEITGRVSLYPKTEPFQYGIS